MATLKGKAMTLSDSERYRLNELFNVLANFTDMASVKRKPVSGDWLMRSSQAILDRHSSISDELVKEVLSVARIIIRTRGTENDPLDDVGFMNRVNELACELRNRLEDSN